MLARCRLLHCAVGFKGLAWRHVWQSPPPKLPLPQRLLRRLGVTATSAAYVCIVAVVSRIMAVTPVAPITATVFTVGKAAAKGAYIVMSTIMGAFVPVARAAKGALSLLWTR